MAIKQLKIGSQNILVDAIASIGGQNLITLYSPLPTGSAKYQTLYRDITAAAYQVTAGKTLYIIGGTIQAGTAATNVSSMGYGDTAVDNSASAPTNNKVLIPAGLHCAAANTEYDLKIWMAIPATKYPYIVLGANGIAHFTVWCFEE